MTSPLLCHGTADFP
ncbi:hypothetical protein EYZ11_005490 [Aspergillus tanneri]|uniref:Uncharacterized protein n=1 Tax=Aspergillus tanneri TaxID=1220188 RepID=A0A4S3JI87_9EURO|nr:hypothetical protein EYZ11_005490 [Aspergillus tanneri]